MTPDIPDEPFSRPGVSTRTNLVSPVRDDAGACRTEKARRAARATMAPDPGPLVYRPGTNGSGDPIFALKLFYAYRPRETG
jgi:hypothetical protein